MLASPACPHGAAITAAAAAAAAAAKRAAIVGNMETTQRVTGSPTERKGAV